MDFINIKDTVLKFIWKPFVVMGHLLIIGKRSLPSEKQWKTLLPKKRKWHLKKDWLRNDALSHNEVGEIGEDLAAQFLKKSGYKVLVRNYQPAQGGEIDIICRKGGLLIFVEVKTRLAPTKYRPLLAITKVKRDQLRKGALQYLQLLKQEQDNTFPPTTQEMNIPTRFDAVEVMLRPHSLPEVNIVENLYLS